MSRHRVPRRTVRRALAVLAAIVCATGVVIAPSPLVPATVAHADDTIDGLYQATGPITAGGTLELQVTGRGGVPSTGVGAVALNVAATNVTAATYLTVWPTGSTRPTAANMNVGAGQTLSNMVIAKVGTGGKVSIYNYTGSIDVVVDVMGWYPTGGQYAGLTPARAADTRPGYPTVDGLFAGSGALRAGGVLDVRVTGRGGVPASGVGAVALNVAVTNVSAPTYLTVWPAGETRPTAANMNATTGQTLSNMVVAKVGAGGVVSVFNYTGSADVVIDVLGWFPAGGQYSGLSPARVADTRPGFVTVDAAVQGTGALGASGVLQLPVLGRGGVPSSGVGAVVLNVAMTNVSAGTFLTAWPTGESRPTAANMNAVAGQTLSNMVVAKVGSGGTVSLFNLAGSADVVVDVMGWFPAGGQYTGLSPARLADTRGGVTVDPPGDPCSQPANMPGSVRVSANPAAAQAINAYPWGAATVEGMVQLTRQVFTAMGPLPAAAAGPAEGWARLQATQQVQAGQALSKAWFVDTLTTSYHEAIHELQGFSCLPTGPSSGFVIASSWWGIGPAQSTTYADVRARVMALVPNAGSFCRSAALSTADVYLSPSDPAMSGQGLRSQLWEINAYVLESELENALIASGVVVDRNTAVQSAKLHQLARYLQAMRSQPGQWDTLRAAGVDVLVAQHWNLAVAQWRSGFSVGRDCWNIAFGPDAATIADFTGGQAGLAAPPMP